MVLIIGYFIYQRRNEFTISEEKVSTENIIKEPEEEKGEKIVVHISGAVEQEGIVELEKNSRIADAIEKVGGLKENAETKGINLAYKLEDGMKIYIPTKEEFQNKESQEMNKENQYVYEGIKENGLHGNGGCRRSRNLPLLPTSRCFLYFSCPSARGK